MIDHPIHYLINFNFFNLFWSFIITFIISFKFLIISMPTIL